MQKASQESSFDPNAKASSSSATGLYQFTQQTWLQMVKNYGGKYNLGTYADHISIDSSGVARVTDPSWKQAILNLRKDPTASSEMAGELDRENQVALKNNVGGKIGGTELYLAHFLGAGGATDFLNEMHDNPKQAAADVLPDAASANPSVFYAKDGTPRTLQQIYQRFAQKFNNPSNTTGTVMVASASTTHANSHANSKSSYAASSAPITVASASATYGGAVFGSTATQFSPTASGNGLKVDGTSLFATMMLSQMNQDSTAIMSQNARNLHNKKNPYNLASMAAVG